jgi:hypothetical protein
VAAETSREIQDEVSYRDLASGPAELPEGIRLRVALDVIAQLFEECAPTLGKRSPKSRLRLSNVRVARDGSSRVLGNGDSTGAQLLLWEMIAGREAPDPPLPRVHDVVDEVSPDVDDVVTNAAILRRMASIDELLEALQEAAGSIAAPREQIATHIASLRAATESAPEPATDTATASEPATDTATASESATEPLPVPASDSDAESADPSAAAAEAQTLALTDDASPIAEAPASPATTPPRDSHTRVAASGEPEVSLRIDPDLPSVLVVGVAGEDNELCAAIEQGGHRVICTEIELAQDAIAAESPSCVVLDVWHDGTSKRGEEPGDIGDAGYRFVHWMRMHDSEAAAIPLLLIAPGAQEASRLSGFLVGADVCLSRPYRVGDIVAQVGALVRMSTRLRKARQWLRSRPVQKAFEGNLAHVSVATLLSVLEMENRTGIFEVLAPQRRVELYFDRGVAVRGRAQGLPVSTLSALESMLGCQRGRFSFTPMSEREGAPRGIGIGELLLEALRRRDEQAHAETGSHNSARGAIR